MILMEAKKVTINKFLTLRFENGSTMVYINGRKFKLFKNLESLHSFKMISYPSKKKEKLTKKQQKAAEEKFLMNCSTLKKWVEEDYNYQLLNGMSAFNILKKLCEIGDSLAKKVFKKEIISAFMSNNTSITKDLKRGGFLNYINKKEMRDLLKNRYNIEEKELNLSKLGLRKIPQFLYEFKNIKTLNLESNNLENISSSIGKLKHLQILNLSYNNLKNLPESIGNLKSLTHLLLINNKLEKLPDTIGNLISLIVLDLGANPNPRVFGTNQLKKVPESIGNLKSLISLDIEENQLESLPDSIGKLKNLEELLLGGNKLKSLPESILNLSPEIMLTLWGNPCLEDPNPTVKKCLDHFEYIEF